MELILLLLFIFFCVLVAMSGGSSSGAKTKRNPSGCNEKVAVKCMHCKQVNYRRRKRGRSNRADRVLGHRY